MIRKLLLLLALTVLLGPAVAMGAEPDEKYIKAARAFLEQEPRVKDMINVMHAGTIPISGTCNKIMFIVYSRGKNVSGHFTIEMRYKWRGPITKNGQTDVHFNFDDKGRLYDFEVIRTNGYAFLVTRAMLEVGKVAVRMATKGKDNEEEVTALVGGIKTVRELQLLKLRVEQMIGK
jgi:hypothetical protein